MAPREACSTQSSSSSAASTSSSHGGSLELSSSSFVIAKKPLKKQPIIRVVHVFAPKLIKTDPANFRALVQQLTGSTAPKHEQEIISNDRHDAEQFSNHQYDPSSNSDYHENTNNLHYVANYGDYEGIRVLKSSSSPKREINTRRKWSCSAAFDTAGESHEALQVGQNLEGATLQSGFLLSSNFSGLDGISGNLEGDNPGLASIDDTDGSGSANLANQDELATTAEGIIDQYNELYRYMSSPSSLEASSSCNTESAGFFEEMIRDGFDEGLELTRSFSDVRRHLLMQYADEDELLLHPTF